MFELIEANWPWFLVVLLIGIAVAWLVFVGSRRTTVTRLPVDASRENVRLYDPGALIGGHPSSPPSTKRTPQSETSPARSSPRE